MKKKKSGQKKEQKAMPSKSLSKPRRAAVPERKPLAARKSENSFEAAIDYPSEGELIVPSHYAVRISAKAGFDVEISTDGKLWEPTRPSVGYHWFDWTPARSGRTILSVRVKVGKGRWKKTSERECVVINNSSN